MTHISLYQVTTNLVRPIVVTAVRLLLTDADKFELQKKLNNIVIVRLLPTDKSDQVIEIYFPSLYYLHP